MRVAVVDVGAAAVRSVVAEPTARGLRRLHDRELALRLDRVTADGDGRAPGTIDLLHDCVARFHEVHRRLQVQRVHLLVDGDRRSALEAGGVLGWLAETLDAEVQPSHAVAEAATVATAAATLGDVDGRPTLLVELDGSVARVALLRRGEVVVGERLPMADLARYAAVSRPADPARWLPVAQAVVLPLLEAVGAPMLLPVVAAGGPVRQLASRVRGTRRRRPVAVGDPVVLDDAQVAVVAGELARGGPGAVATGTGPADGPVLAGTAVVLAGLVTGVTGCGVRCTDARRVDGHLARWFPAPAREHVPSG